MLQLCLLGDQLYLENGKLLDNFGSLLRGEVFFAADYSSLNLILRNS